MSRTTRRGFTLGAVAALADALPGRGMAAADNSPLPVGWPAAGGYRLVKDWNFASGIRDSKSLRAEFHTRYIYAKGTLDHLNQEWSRYRDNGNHVFTPEGLALVARVTNGLRPGMVHSGMLRSRWSGRLGVFEIRMKVPRGRGLWPAFWLNPQDGKWPPEIDVVEIVDNGRDTTRQSFHVVHGRGNEDMGFELSKLDKHRAYRPGIDYADNFHVFSVEWTEHGVRHFVDGTKVADQKYRWVHDDGSDGGAAHVLVNLAVGGKWPGPPAIETSFPASLTVQYVRVWQR